MSVVDDQLTTNQRARRERMLDVTLDLAADGGLEGVHMREVADRAEVALGTLYRYFPSKEHLVVSAMTQSVVDLRDVLARRPPEGETAAARVSDVLGRANRFLTRRPRLTGAMVRALTSGDDVAEVVGEVTTVMTGIIADAIDPAGCSDPAAAGDNAEVARLLNYVWLAALVSWVSGGQPAAQIDRDLTSAAARLLD